MEKKTEKEITGKVMNAFGLNEEFEKNKQQSNWESKLYLIEQFAGDLYSYALLSAMESSKISGKNRQLTVVANQIKTFAETIRTMLNNYKQDSNAKIMIRYMANDDVVSRDELKEMNENLVDKADKVIDDNNLKDGADLKAEFATIMYFITGSLESIVLKGILEAYKSEASALLICLEEIRKTVLDLNKIFKNQEVNNRQPWQPIHKIEASKMRTNSKKSEYLSFNIGKHEIIEEFCNIAEIFNYKDYNGAIEQVASGENPHLQFDSDNFIKIDAYLDLYQLFNISRPTDLNDMKILIIKMPSNYKLGSYKNIAIAVDFVNYPLLTGSGDEQISDNQEIKSEYIRSCWFSMQTKSLLPNVIITTDKEKNELIFLDWQKLLVNHETLMIQNSCVLLVDDDDDAREVITQILEIEGLIKVIQAISGKAAVELAAKNKFDLIISDLNMPGMDGLETIKKVKELQPNISSMIMTGFDSFDIAIKAFSEKMIDDFLAKPIGNEDLINKTKSFLTNKSHPGFNSKEADKQ